MFISRHRIHDIFLIMFFYELEEEMVLFQVTLKTFLIFLYVKNISRSSQCSTTGVTKAVICVILSMGWCI